MSENVARRLILGAAAYGEKTFKAYGQVAPVWLVVDRDGENVVLKSPWSSEEERSLAAIQIRAMLAEMDAAAYVFICESWMVHKKLEGLHPSVLERIRHMRVADQAERVEVIWYTAEDASGFASAFQRIEHPQGRPSFLRALEWLPTDQVEGGFVAMLPVKAGARRN